MFSWVRKIFNQHINSNHTITDGLHHLKHYGLEYANAVLVVSHFQTVTYTENLNVKLQRGLPPLMLESARSIASQLELSERQKYETENAKTRERRQAMLKVGERSIFDQNAAYLTFFQNPQIREDMQEFVALGCDMDREQQLLHLKRLQRYAASQIVKFL